MQRIVFIIFIVLAGLLQVAVANDTNKFQQYTYTDGLFDNNVFDYCNDDDGYLWVATANHVYRFNGHQFELLFPTPDASNRPDIIWAPRIYNVDSEIWAFTRKGLYRFDKASKQFTPVTLPKGVGTATCLYSNNNQLLIGTTNGIAIIKNQTSATMKFTKLPAAKGLYCYEIYKANDGLFVGTGRGAYNLNEHGDSITLKNDILSNYRINDFCQISPDELWIATERNGIFIKKEGKIRPLSEVYSQFKLSSPFIRKIKKISNNQIWIATFEGIFVIDQELNQLQHLTKPAIYGNSVYQIFQDSLQNIWIGGHGSGVTLGSSLDAGISYSGDLYPEASKGMISTFSKDHDNLWLGTVDQPEIMQVNEQNQTSRVIKSTHQKQILALESQVKIIFNDSQNELWLGTDEKGLFKYNPNRNEFINILPDTLFKQNHSAIEYMNEDANGNLLLGRYTGGLILFHKNSQYSKTPIIKTLNNESIKGITYDPENKKNYIATSWQVISWDGSKIETITTTPGNTNFSSIDYFDNKLVCGTNNAGIFIYDINTKQGKLHKNTLNTDSDRILAAIWDKDYRIWITSLQGLSVFSLKNGGFTNYLAGTDLGPGQFANRSAYSSPDGQIFFGGEKGYLKIEPQNYNLPHLNSIHIQSLSIPGDTSILKPLQPQNQIKLNYPNNTIHVKLATNTFHKSLLIKYQVLLEGYHSTWTNTENEFNLYAIGEGNHTLKVRATINGIEYVYAKSMLITVAPPWWRNNWAIAIYLLLTILTIGASIIMIRRRTQEKHELQLIRMKQKQREKLNQARINYFTELSHEFRTPLTIIQATIDRLRRSDFEQSKIAVDKIKNQASQLHQMINQLLDFRSAEHQMYSINLHPENINALLSSAIDSINPIAREKEIEILYTPSTINNRLIIDTDVINKIITNLLSNAIKYSPSHSQVNVSAHYRFPKLEIIVKDNGEGIDPSKLKDIFNPYERDHKGTEEGTGLGLSLSKKLAQLHNGDIHIESTLNKGTKATVTIQCEQQTSRDKQTNDSSKDLLLLVEDNIALASEILQGLNSQYNTQHAVSGEEALAMIKEEQPDLVITDIQLKGMDGISLCNAIKQNTSTSHIPVIIVSGLTGTTNQLKGMKAGALDYIEKPFSLELLILKIQNALQQREQIRMKVINRETFTAPELKVENRDNKFLDELSKTMEEHYDNPEFDAETMVKVMSMGHASFYRKVKALTGQTPGNILRSYRLQAAAKLTGQGLSISEIAFKVGFNDPKYFSRCFKSEFGQSPTAYFKPKSS
ncbi:hybrid sensor histidine kinase/response regulator [Puteibacter caeruleilacunae]|nr:hybrid sensor histidine kinase/response regulator [Puteibacter caeruleilacunae]